MEQTVVHSEVNIVKKKSAAGTFGKFVGMAFGVCGILLGSALCLTIIGALVGFPLMIMSLGLIASAQGFQQVQCPSCGKRAKVLKTAENFDCPKCRQFTVINWK
jgi:ssDNA-binding Zn-finger/Zn-ribbon topoisomerase 1